MTPSEMKASDCLRWAGSCECCVKKSPDELGSMAAAHSLAARKSFLTDLVRAGAACGVCGDAYASGE